MSVIKRRNRLSQEDQWTPIKSHHAIYIVIDTIHPLANQSCYLQNGQLIMTQQSVSIGSLKEGVVATVLQVKYSWWFRSDFKHTWSVCRYILKSKNFRINHLISNSRSLLDSESLLLLHYWCCCCLTVWWMISKNTFPLNEVIFSLAHIFCE